MHCHRSAVTRASSSGILCRSLSTRPRPQGVRGDIIRAINTLSPSILPTSIARRFAINLGPTSRRRCVAVVTSYKMIKTNTHQVEKHILFSTGTGALATGALADGAGAVTLVLTVGAVAAGISFTLDLSGGIVIFSVRFWGTIGGGDASMIRSSSSSILVIAAGAEAVSNPVTRTGPFHLECNPQVLHNNLPRLSSLHTGLSDVWHLAQTGGTVCPVGRSDP